MSFSIRSRLLSQHPILEVGQPDTSLMDVTLQRVLTGSSTSRGQLSVSITNHRNYEMQAVYVETLPWHIQFYLHTMKATVDGNARGKVFYYKAFLLKKQLTTFVSP